MTTYQITKNGKALVSGLTKEAALNKLFPIVEDYSSGYIYDNEAETIYHEIDKRAIATKGDESVRAGNILFEVTED